MLDRIDEPIVIREGGAEFRWTFRGWSEPGTDEIYIDPMRMEQALANLLLNAKKYTPRDGRIEVIVRKALDGTTGDPALLVEVQDSGPGIAEGDLPFVFERFYRSGEARKTSPAGMGLGLAICKEIVEQHGGRVQVSSRLGLGSTFTIALPLRAGLTKAGMTR
ncbi:sensor histidine kinase [Kyrpidia tusciae]|uniref:histidine kinase n=1 Tax=Kyrpidia tusciae (strain DSM 2912 / NBRC 15312 / T2) TaxID=562970 RepID=D5WTK5_KYRT2|nr:ATP-binding protein [Kyrpidia tusciae]ADG07241.1 histidine kinase [Kyrpidia tusciae DSM 2912]